MEQVEEEQKVPATATPAHTVEADVLLIAKLNASLRSHFLLEHPDRPQVKAERAACLQRIRATMAATHQVGFLLMPSGVSLRTQRRMYGSMRYEWNYTCRNVFHGLPTTTLSLSLVQALAPTRATLSPQAFGWPGQGQPSQGTRAFFNAAVEAQVTAVVAAAQLFRAGGDKETAVASRDAALAAIRSTMATLHPEVRFHAHI